MKKAGQKQGAIKPKSNKQNICMCEKTKQQQINCVGPGIKRVLGDHFFGILAWNSASDQ